MTGATFDLVFLLAPVVFLFLGFSVGRWRERAHFRSLARREGELAGIRACNLRQVTDPASVADARMVLGEAVIATDYFKTFIARLRLLVGGRVGAFESLMERARREAHCRMLEQAARLGATEVWNVRQETSNIVSAGRRNAGVSVEVLAFGTAVRRHGPVEVA